MSMSKKLSTALALLSLTVAARADGQHIAVGPLCVTESDATQQMQSWLEIHDGSTLSIMEDEEAAAWLSVFNTDMPPITDYKADKLWIVDNPKEDGDSLYVALFSGGKTCNSIHPTREAFEAIEARAKANRQ